MAYHIFKGLGIALVTPFTLQGEVDYEALKRLVEYQIANGADFFCILATTGEVPCLTQEEKDKITKLVLEINQGRLPILKYCVEIIPAQSSKRYRIPTGRALMAS